jgi:hypothetical protein
MPGKTTNKIESWNSAIFPSFPYVAIPRAVVTQDFQTSGDNWTLSDPLAHKSWWKGPTFGQNTTMIYALQDEATTYTVMNTTDCVKLFVDPLTPTSSLILVAANLTTAQANGSSLIDGWVSAWELWSHSTSWICEAYQLADETPKYCDWQFAETFADTWQLSWPEPIAVDHCLVGPQGNNNERCGLNYSVYILAIVCGCTLVQWLLIWWTCRHHQRLCATRIAEARGRTMITMGDAIQSYLEYPDPAWTDFDDIAKLADSHRSRLQKALTIEDMIWPTKHRVSWFRAVGTSGWAISTMLYVNFELCL